MVACDSCASIMKKCVECRTQIEQMVPLNVCCGGQGQIAKIGPNIEDNKNETMPLGVNQTGHGVVMNNQISSANNSQTNSTITTPAAVSTTNNSAVATTTVNQLDDVQKLQQQLQDIKEQVRIFGDFFYFYLINFWVFFCLDNVSSLF